MSDLFKHRYGLFKRPHAVSLAVAVFLMVCAGRAQAATLYFATEGSSFGIDASFRIGLMVDADDPVNTLLIEVPVPAGLEVVDISDGNSIINLWIERPSFDRSERILSFSGIIPGGFSGRGGQLATITVRAAETGIFRFAYGSGSQLLRHDASHTKESLSTMPLNIPIEAGGVVVQSVRSDMEPPETFTPYIATSTAIFDGQPALYFETQDKGSGMYGYEIAEWPEWTEGYVGLPWQTAESPFLLRDHGLSRYIYVKATDKEGNWRVEVLSPSNPHGARWSESAGSVIIILIALALALSWFRCFKKSKSVD